MTSIVALYTNLFSFIASFTQRGGLTLSLPESNLQSIKVVVPFESVDKTLVCDYSNESC